MASELYKNLDWDSQFFAYKVALIHSDKINSEAELKTCLKDLRENKYRLAYAFVEAGDESRNKVMQTSGGILADKKTTFSTVLNDQASKTEHVENFSGPVAEVLDLAIESGIYSRFNVDENFRNKEFERLYTEWITASVNRKIADEVLVYKEDGHILGLVTLKQKDSSGQIGLIAVSERARGKGIGKKLIQASHAWYGSRGIQKADVVTQGDNIPACKLYEKCGYHVSSVQHVYHFWF